MSSVNVVVTGASGFLGTRLVQKLLEAGHAVHVLGRRRGPGLPPAVQFSEWRSTEVEPPLPLPGNRPLDGEPLRRR